MSLINEVLRDLDSRHAADSERMGLAHQVRALPPVEVPWWKKAALPVLAAVVGGTAVWFFLSAPVSAPAPQNVAIASPAETSPDALAPEAAVLPVAPSAAQLELTSVPLAESPSLKLDVEMSKAPLEAAGSKRATKANEAATKESKETNSLSNKVTPVSAMPNPAVAVPLAESAIKTITVPSASGKAMAPVHPQISKQSSGGGSLNEQAEAEYQRGLTALRRGAATEAGEAFRAALKLQGNHSLARHALLSQLVEQRQWQAVEVVALDGLGSLPARHDWALLAARVQFERGDAAQALDTMSSHASYARKSADYQVFHALLLQRANRPAEAVTCYQTALAINAGEGRWWYGLARALEADQREPEARQAYEKARDSGNLPADLAAVVERRLR